MRKPVNTKADFVRRYRAGEFGNAAPTWETATKWIASDWSIDFGQLFHLRSRIKGGPTYYNLPANDLYKLVLLHGWQDSPDWYVSAMAPTEKTIINGEVKEFRDFGEPAGWDLTYSTVKKTMRESLAEKTEHAQGLTAKGIIKAAMNSASYEWLNVLMDHYPNHTIEFSVYETNWGTVPGFNAVFWEVRNY